MRTCLLSFILSLLVAAAGPPSLASEGKLSLRECIEIALRSNPSMQIAEGGQDASEGKLVQSLSPYYPHLQATTGYAESHAAGGAFGDSVTKNSATTLLLNQLIYDFGRTGGSSDAARAGVRAAEQEQNRTRLEVILGVKQAYYALLQAQHLVAVAEKTIEQSESHLRQAEAFYRTGAKPRFDVTRAEVELNNSRLGGITARSSLRLGAISLNKAMGVEPGRPVAIEGIRFAMVTMPSLSTVEAEAVRSRPEMLKAEAEVQAARARVSAERSGYLPTVSASGQYVWAQGTAASGQFRGDIGNSWNTAVTLTLPLFEGKVTSGRVGEARGNLLAVEAQRDALRQAILLEVNRAYADFESAGARLDVMESSLKKARENLDIAQGRYRSGVGPYLEVTDAQVVGIKAETDYYQAQYDYQLAVAKLEMAMGVIRVE